MTDPPPILARYDGTVIVSGEGLVLMYRVALAARHHRDGVASPPLLHTLRATLYRAATSRPRHQDDSRPPTTSCCTCQDGADPIGVAEAAAILSLSPRQVQRLAASVGLSGIRLGHAWALDRGAVLALARRKEAAK